MRNKLLLAGAIVVVVGAGIASVYHYQDHKNKQVQASQQAIVAQAKEQDRVNKERQLVADTHYRQVRILTAECLKGKAIYASLSAFAQKTVQAPNCNPGE